MSYLQHLNRSRITGGILLVACAVSFAWWAGMSIDWLAMTFVPLAQQPWTLLTSALPHVNIVHLLFNCYWMVVLGSFFEIRFGKQRTIVCFALWAAASALAEFVFLDGGVGLSGVVYALWAFFAILRRRRYLVAGPIGEREDQLFVAWFFICIVLTYSGVMPVANIAHGAGAVFGALSAMAVSGNRKLWRSVMVATLLLLVIAATALRPQLNSSTYYTDGLAYEAWQLRDQERWPEAEAKLRLVLQRSPNAADQWAALGGVLVHLERFSEAGQAYERAFAIAPGNALVRRAVAWWHGWLAGQAFDCQDLETSAKEFRLACNLEASNARFRRGLAETHDLLQNAQAAREAYEVLLQLEPDDELARKRLEELSR